MPTRRPTRSTFSVTGTIQLTNVGHVGEIVINNNLTINGPVPVCSRSGLSPATASGGRWRADLQRGRWHGNGADVAISGLTLTGGDVASILGGGAISNRENLTVTALTITGNSAGSTTTGFHGGGIVNFGGNLTVNASTISGNTVLFGRGGGIYSTFGTMTISQSTISGNFVSSTGSGGGIYSSYTTTTDRFEHDLGQYGEHRRRCRAGRHRPADDDHQQHDQRKSARINGGGVVALFGDVNRAAQHDHAQPGRRRLKCDGQRRRRVCQAPWSAT